MKIFKEEQRFTQLWLIILVLVSTLVPLAIIVGSYIENPERFSPLEFALIVVLIVLACGLIFIFKLSTRVDEIGIHYKFFPFHINYKHIYWKDIKSAHIRTYDAIAEYGGWGLKGGALWNKSNGTAINVSGNIGMQLELKNGKKLLIGTNKPNEAKAVLETYKHQLITITNV